jgi:AmiR/NasT family two-component response regulator
MTEQSTQTIRVLLAEDDDNARTLLVDLLNTLGHVVVAEVATGREAFEKAHELVPDVVLLDVHMPDGSGIEAAEKITHDTPGVAVVLFSGDQSLVLSDKEVESTSAIAFLPKPAPPRVLDSTIRLAARRAKELSSARKDAQSSKQQLENRKVIERAKGILHGIVGAGGVSNSPADVAGSLRAHGRDCEGSAGERAGDGGGEVELPTQKWEIGNGEWAPAKSGAHSLCNPSPISIYAVRVASLRTPTYIRAILLEASLCRTRRPPVPHLPPDCTPTTGRWSR